MDSRIENTCSDEKPGNNSIFNYIVGDFVDFSRHVVETMAKGPLGSVFKSHVSLPFRYLYVNANF